MLGGIKKKFCRAAAAIAIAAAHPAAAMLLVRLHIYAVPSMCNSFGQQAADLSFILLRETILFSLTQQYNQISPSISILGMIPRPAVCCPFCKIRCFKGKNYNSRHIWFN